jgi:lipoprotein
MMKKLLLIFVVLISIVACTKIKVNPIKPVITQGLKTILQTKNDVQMAVIPDGDKELTLNGQTYKVKGETFQTIKDYLSANNKVEQTVVDLVGDQITDENIATIAYYADKYSVNAKDLLNSLNK